MSIWFGPAGNEDAFAAAGYKSSLFAPEYVSELGLNAYEYQCGRGVHIGEQAAALLGENAKRCGVRLSVHSPYYISLSAEDKAISDKSIAYILQTCAAAKAMGAGRIVVHAGSSAGKNRDEALKRSAATLKRALAACDEQGYDTISLCVETMGKVNQLGTVEECTALCGIDERLLPCLDFGHINARDGGRLQGSEDYETIFRFLENAIGADRTARFHAHFSRIEYGKGGEVRHLTFEDREYGPFFEHLAPVIVKHSYKPVIICESAGTQACDAASMMIVYKEARKAV